MKLIHHPKRLRRKLLHRRRPESCGSPQEYGRREQRGSQTSALGLCKARGRGNKWKQEQYGDWVELEQAFDHSRFSSDPGVRIQRKMLQSAKGIHYLGSGLQREERARESLCSRVFRRHLAFETRPMEEPGSLWRVSPRTPTKAELLSCLTGAKVFPEHAAR